MNKFFDYLQPTIVQLGYDEELPEELRGHFFVNFNVFAIDYFNENYILTENEVGTPYLLLKEDKFAFELENNIMDDDILDAPRLYIPITDKFVNDDGALFASLVYQGIAQNSIYAIGIDDFLAGKDYYLNYTLYNFLANTNQVTKPNFGARLPNYIDSTGNITKYWIDRSSSPYKDYTNLEYYRDKNNALDNEFPEDMLKNFYANFCGLILKYMKIDDGIRSTTENQIYDKVLNYYAGFKNDDASLSINLILNSLYATTTNKKCGCQTGQNAADISTISCYDLYGQAMATYLKQMLGSYDFYEDWFKIQLDGADERVPNDLLCDKLIQFINEFLGLGLSLSFGGQTTNKNCSCKVVDTSESTCNIKAIENYINVLNWARTDTMASNKNKTRIFGQQFGEILPMLQF